MKGVVHGIWMGGSFLVRDQGGHVCSCVLVGFEYDMEDWRI